MQVNMFVAAVLALTSSTVWGSAAEPSYERDVVPFLKRHCVACHGPDKQKGGARFDGPMPELTDAKLSEQWLAARRMLAQGDMPPEGRPRPGEEGPWPQPRLCVGPAPDDFRTHGRAGRGLRREPARPR